MPSCPMLARCTRPIGAVILFAALGVWLHGASAQPAQAPADSLQVLNMNSYTDSSGRFTVLGLVHNNQNSSVDNIQVYVKLYNKTGAVMASNRDYLHDYMLSPGQYSAFSSSFDPAVSNGWAYFQVTATFDPKPDPDVPALELKQYSASIDPNGNFHLSGKLSNRGNATVQFAQVNGGFFDAQKRLVVVDFENAGMSSIAPNQSVPFQFTIYGDHAKDIRFSLLNALSYDANRYTTIGNNASPSAPSLVPVNLVIRANNDSVSVGNQGIGALDAQNKTKGSYGENAVPEFPLPAVALLGGIAGAILIARRLMGGSMNTYRG